MTPVSMVAGVSEVGCGPAPSATTKAALATAAEPCSAPANRRTCRRLGTSGTPSGQGTVGVVLCPGDDTLHTHTARCRALTACRGAPTERTTQHVPRWSRPLRQVPAIVPARSALTPTLREHLRQSPRGR